MTRSSRRFCSCQWHISFHHALKYNVAVNPSEDVAELTEPSLPRLRALARLISLPGPPSPSIALVSLACDMSLCTRFRHTLC